jgi:cytochrome d ubiquinol oxidase subunit II
MLIITVVGFPFVLAYTAWVYRTFRGPVRLDEHSY